MAGDMTMAVDLSTPEKTVAQGARVMETAEATAAKLRVTIAKLVPVIEAGKGFGWVGKLKAGELAAEAFAIAGLAAEAEARLYRLHQACTEIADKNGVDLPQPQGGGDR